MRTKEDAPADREDERRSARGNRVVTVAAAVWVGCIAAIFAVSRGRLPFNRPALASLPDRAQIFLLALLLAFPLFLMGVTRLLTRRRAVPDLAARSPEPRTARREVLLLWSYGAAVLAVGQVVGVRLFGEGIGLHLNGSIFGATRLQTPREVWFWAGYNFLLYAVLPYVVFRRRGYSHEALNLRSAERKNDALVVLVILALESALELATAGFFKLNGHQMALGALLSFVVHLLGTGLPVMVFIYSILLPRYARLGGSTAATVLLGGLSYAALHVCEYWTVYDSLPHAVLSLLFVLTTFIGPGLIKSYLTVRTGNAWVHLWAYHAFAPHVTSDAPVVVKVFGIR
jgi:hypothetical protein